MEHFRDFELFDRNQGMRNITVGMSVALKKFCDAANDDFLLESLVRT
jgi:hypothetical protein